MVKEATRSDACTILCEVESVKRWQTIIFIYGCQRKMRRDLWLSSSLLCRIRLPVPLVFLCKSKRQNCI